jgi:hypothetical protein
VGFSQEEIDTDRPDQTETPTIVPTGRFQMENGFEHQQNGKKERTLTLPTSLWKFGISKNLELRLTTEFIHDKMEDSTVYGLKPILIGFKVKLFEEKGILPQTSFITHLLIPKLASRDLQASYLATELRFLFQNSLSEDIDLGYNIGVQWDGKSADPVYAYTFSPNIAITKKLKAYGEAYGFLPQHASAEHWIDGGFIFLITKDIQIDIAAGYELTTHSNFHQYFETLGISFRI